MKRKFDAIPKVMRLTCLFILIAIISILGCGPLKEGRVQENGSDNNEVDQKTLKPGYEAFFRGDFQRAEKFFRTHQHAENLEISQKARFASICTQLILADSVKLKKEVMKRFEISTGPDTVKLDGNDLKILEIVLKRLIAQNQKENAPKADLKKGDADQFQEKLKMKDLQIHQLIEHIKTMKNEVKTLNDKIKSIEEIDQKIQEKKTPQQRGKLF